MTRCPRRDPLGSMLARRAPPRGIARSCGMPARARSSMLLTRPGGPTPGHCSDGGGAAQHQQLAICSNLLDGDTSERQVSEAEDKQVIASGAQKQNEKSLTALQAKAEDLEARSHQNSREIVGLAESTNVGNMQTVECLLIGLMRREHFSDIFVVEHAHCLLAPHPVPGTRPGPIIARLFNYQSAVPVRGTANTQL
ncbi:hypothetical protein NDU88_002626 [Pleurodeles waltl]|uniref:Uncharacterized protein n=1 Tax=Pleurodeles waltl TaxID=8319 RepID=A0AAV7WQ16_PLEWA|nr:hypothetical protein NDU88_002626 [Pleurodeles waltl]